MAERPPRIVIAGAGLGGLALAAGLVRRGADVAVYEQTSEFRRVGAGIHVAPNALKILFSVGLSPELTRETAYFPACSRHRDGDTGKLTAELAFLGEDAEDYGAPYTLWHRGDLHAALTGLVPPETIRRGHRIAAIDDHGDGVRIEFADGSSTEADVLVAADGAHSIIRTALFGSTNPQYSGRVAYRATVPRDAIGVDDLDPLCKWWGQDRHFVHYQVSAGREVAFTTSVPEAEWTGESWSAQGDVQALRAAFEGWHPHVQAVLAACPSVYKWGIHVHEPLPRWSAGRVVLLGDAAHTMPPYMGQGGAMSFEDAAVLLRCLDGVSADPADLGTAFAAYELTRKPRTTQIQATSKANTYGRYGRDAVGVYGYDARSVPLVAPGSA